MTTTPDKTLRLECLEKALRISATLKSQDDIVKLAQEFYDFIKNDNQKPKRRR